MAFNIVSGQSSLVVARSLAHLLQGTLIEPKTEHFKDGELKVALPQLQGGCVVVQSTTSHEDWMELFLLLDACRRMSVYPRVALIPYMGYSRQSQHEMGSSLSLDLMARLLITSGATHIITLDLHDPQSERFFKDRPFYNVDPTPFWASCVERESMCFVAPDQGSQIRVQKLGDLLNLPVAFLKKERNPHRVSLEKGTVLNKKCLIIDDILDSGATLCEASHFLKSQGALCVTAFVTHAVLSKDALENLEGSYIERVMTTTSVIPLKGFLRMDKTLNYRDICHLFNPILREILCI